MYKPKKHLIQGYNYVFFDSVKQFDGFVDHEMTKLNAHNDQIWKEVLVRAENRIISGSDWYGTPIPKSISELKNHDTFLAMHLLDKLRPKIQQHLHKFLSQLNVQETLPPELAYNDKSLGIFSFDRAAMGLYHAIPINLNSPVDQINSQLHIALNKSRIQTSVKNVYAYFKEQPTQYPSLTLYLQAGGNQNIKGNDLLYVGLACAELVSYLEARQVPVSINVLIGSSVRNKVNIAIIKVKGFDSPLDLNQLLLLGSDPRYFRFRGFMGIISLSNYFNRNITKGLGIQKGNMAKNLIETLNIDAEVFEQSYSLQAASNEVLHIVNNFNQKINKK